MTDSTAGNAENYSTSLSRHLRNVAMVVVGCYAVHGLLSLTGWAGWGHVRPLGTLRLMVSAVHYLAVWFYLAVVVVESASLIRKGSRWHWIWMSLGAIAFVGAVLGGLMSLGLQLTTAHHQGPFHWPVVHLTTGAVLILHVGMRAGRQSAV